MGQLSVHRERRANHLLPQQVLLWLAKPFKPCTGHGAQASRSSLQLPHQSCS